MHKKWIINNGNFLMGHKDFHKDFLKDNTLTIGGGWWHLDKETNTLILYSRSQDFGQVSEEVVRKAYKRPSVEGYEIFFSQKDSLEEVLKDFKLNSK